MAAGRIRVFGEAFSRIDAAWPDNAFGWRLGLQTSTDLGVTMRKGGLGPAQRSDSD
jgi:hypothetical protein